MDQSIMKRGSNTNVQERPPTRRGRQNTDSVSRHLSPLATGPAPDIMEFEGAFSFGSSSAAAPTAASASLNQTRHQTSGNNSLNQHSIQIPALKNSSDSFRHRPKEKIQRAAALEPTPLEQARQQQHGSTARTAFNSSTAAFFLNQGLAESTTNPRGRSYGSSSRRGNQKTQGDGDILGRALTQEKPKRQQQQQPKPKPKPKPSSTIDLCDDEDDSDHEHADVGTYHSSPPEATRKQQQQQQHHQQKERAVAEEITSDLDAVIDDNSDADDEMSSPPLTKNKNRNHNGPTIVVGRPRMSSTSSSEDDDYGPGATSRSIQEQLQLVQQQQQQQQQQRHRQVPGYMESLSVSTTGGGCPRPSLDGRIPRIKLPSPPKAAATFTATASATATLAKNASMLFPARNSPTYLQGGTTMVKSSSSSRSRKRKSPSPTALPLPSVNFHNVPPKEDAIVNTTSPPPVAVARAASSPTATNDHQSCHEEIGGQTLHDAIDVDDDDDDGVKEEAWSTEGHEDGESSKKSGVRGLIDKLTSPFRRKQDSSKKKTSFGKEHQAAPRRDASKKRSTVRTTRDSSSSDGTPTATDELPADLRGTIQGTYYAEKERKQKLVGNSRRPPPPSPSSHSSPHEGFCSSSSDDDHPNDDHHRSGANFAKAARTSQKKKSKKDGSEDVRNALEHLEVDADHDFGAEGHWVDKKRRRIVDEDDDQDEYVPTTKPETKGSFLSFSKANNNAPSGASGSAQQKTKYIAKRKSSTVIIAGSTFSTSNRPITRTQCQNYSDYGDDDKREMDESSTNLNEKRRSPRHRPAASKTPEILDIISSDDEGSVEEVFMDQEPMIESELTRIAIGKKVVQNECLLTFDPNKLELRLDWKNAKAARTRSDDRHGRWTSTICLRDGTLQRFVVYQAPQRGDGGSHGVLVTTSNDSEIDGKSDGVEHLSSFIALCVEPGPQNGLQKFSKSYKPNHEEAKYRFIVLEFRDRDQFFTIVDRCGANRLRGVLYKEVDRASCAKYAQSLIDDFSSQKRLKKRNKFVDGRALDYTLLVYPFAADARKIEGAARGLTEASRSVEIIEKIGGTESSKDDDEEGEGKARQRAHFVTINVEDYDRLDPGEWLNDSLVDLWMQWISRDDTTLGSKFHFFTSHFFSTLANEGPEAVASWTKRKKINIFDKRLIFIPINKHMHWSLCVIVNPGAIVDGGERERTKDDPLSCMIFMDSLRMHNKNTVARNVRKWLNNEWQRMANEKLNDNTSISDAPFKEDNFRIFCPKVPLQNNTWDCGVFVCRYAYAVYELRNRDFTYGDAGMYCEESDVARGAASRAFHDLISDGAEFDFNMEDIARFREEFKTLIENLSDLFQKAKAAEKALEQEQKRQRQASEASSAPDADDSKEADQRNHLKGTHNTLQIPEVGLIGPSAPVDETLPSEHAAPTRETQTERSDFGSARLERSQEAKQGQTVMVSDEKENVEGRTESKSCAEREEWEDTLLV